MNSTVSLFAPDAPVLHSIPLDRPARYPSRFPWDANLNIVPQNWRSTISPILNRQFAELPAAQIARLANCVVFGNGFVAASDGRQITETLKPSGPEDFSRKGASIITEKCFLARKHGDSNFGHWLVELLPRVVEALKTPGFSDCYVAIPRGPKEMLPMRMRTLEWIGVPASRVIPINNDPTLLSDVSVISSNSIHSHTHHAEGILAVRAGALRAVHARPGSSRLYVARRSSLRRRILNETAALDVLQRHGFEVIYPEDYSIDKQVSIFSNADLVVGASGAALTNIIFAPQSCRVLSMMPNYGMEFFFWDIANIIGQEFSYLFGEAAEPSQAMHSDFTVDVQRLSNWLNTG